MFKFNKDPIHVVVYASRWDSYGKPGSFRAHYLFELLKRNGISDSVEPGHYVFNAIRKGLKLELSLTPAFRIYYNGYSETTTTKGIEVSRIPLSRLIKAIANDQADEDVVPDMVVLNGPVYFLTVDGEVNVVYDVSPSHVLGVGRYKLIASLRKHKIPKQWASFEEK